MRAGLEPLLFRAGQKREKVLRNFASSKSFLGFREAPAVRLRRFRGTLLGIPVAFIAATVTIATAAAVANGFGIEYGKPRICRPYEGGR
jgi:hypothetical protein